LHKEESMITQSMLNDAKSFLCWDCFPDLSVQLAPMAAPVSYYYPPGESHSILIFYDSEDSDFSKPLFLLFHEAGHHQQFIEMQERGDSNQFWKQINIPNGLKRKAFEENSWDRGCRLFNEFIQKQRLDANLLQKYEKYASKQMKSYM